MKLCTPFTFAFGIPQKLYQVSVPVYYCILLYILLYITVYYCILLYTTVYSVYIIINGVKQLMLWNLSIVVTVGHLCAGLSVGLCTTPVSFLYF